MYGLWGSCAIRLDMNDFAKIKVQVLHDMPCGDPKRSSIVTNTLPSHAIAIRPPWSISNFGLRHGGRCAGSDLTCELQASAGKRKYILPIYDTRCAERFFRHAYFSVSSQILRTRKTRANAKNPL